MPWKTADVDEHIKGLSDKQKNVWVRVANKALTTCEEAGKSGCEASAIKQANALAKGMQEAGCVIGEDGTVTFEEPLRESDEKPGPILRAIEGVAKLLKGKLQTEAGTELHSDLTPLIESKIRPDGTMPVKLAAPGWGQTGYYSAAVLERDGPKVFRRGTHMYLDHPTRSESHERPERSLRDLAGTLASDGRWEPNGQAGPGIYADAHVVEGFRGSLSELAPDIGLSLRGFGVLEDGEAEGKSGKIVQSLAVAESVDFVTKAAAGGKVLELMESARGRLLKQTKGDPEMSEQELKEAREALATAEKERDTLKEAQTTQGTELARLQEGEVLREATAIVTEALGKVENLPELTRARLQEALSKAPPTKDGALDKDALATAIDEAAKAEVEYLSKLTESGAIKGMGGSGGGTEGDTKALEESWKHMHPDWSPEQIAIAVNGR